MVIISVIFNILDVILEVAVKQLGEAADIGREAGAKADESMTELVDRVKEAVAILDVISGITKKTTMLALNASIEAARAGEAGRGFAVVANEISDLSSETDSATGKINKIHPRSFLI